MYSKCVKRAMDFTLSLLALIVLSPILLIIAILVRVKLGSPVIFSQNRPGKDEKIFKLYKFRSMTDECDENGEPLPDEVRLTRFGRRLRSTSMDELPELWNILKGDMAIVGPRPLLPEYLPYYTDEERHRHDVRPGLTGLAQVNGRNTSTWQETFKNDTYYVNNVSLHMDVWIICATIVKVVKRADIVMGNDNKVGRMDEERKNRKGMYSVETKSVGTGK